MIATIIAAAFAVWTGAVWYYSGEYHVDAQTKRADAAEARLVEKDKALEQEAANKIIDMSAAFDAGQAKAKTVFVNTVTKGQTYVANTPVFSNLLCTVPDDGMHILASARAGLRTAPAPDISDATVPRTGTDTRRQNVEPLPSIVEGQRPLAGVHPKPRALNRTDTLPGRHL